MDAKFLRLLADKIGDKARLELEICGECMRDGFVAQATASASASRVLAGLRDAINEACEMLELEPK